MERVSGARAGAGLIVAVLTVGTFAMGCAEMLIIGMIDLISADLDVSVPATGALVTSYALGIAAGGPLLALLTTSMDRRHVLIASAAAFALLNLLPVAGAGHELFVAGRFAAGSVQGLFIAAALTAVSEVVPSGREGQAMGVVISGFAGASAVGMPLGAWLGQTFGWQSAFAAVVVVSLVLVVAAYLVVPSVATSKEARTKDGLRRALGPRVLALLGLFTLNFAAVQAALTYLVPFLDEVTGVSGGGVIGFLLAYGIATTVGSVLGARFADHHPARVLVIGAIGLTLSLVMMYLFGGHVVAVVVALVGMGLFAMGVAPAMQTRVMSLAGPGAALAASLPASAANVGDAIGSALGGVAVDQAGISAAIVTGGVIAALAIAVALATSRLGSSDRDASPADTSMSDSR